MSFRQLARRVANPDRPLIFRQGAFRLCVASYCRLTRQSYQETLSRLRAAFAAGSQVDLDGEQLAAAIEALSVERNIFLARLHLFYCRRCERKRFNRAPPSPADVDSLYRTDYLATKYDGDSRHAPRVYVVLPFDGGARLVKRPLREQAQLESETAGRIFGPWTEEELVAYYEVAFSTRGYAWPFRRRAIAEFFKSSESHVLECGGPVGRGHE